MLARVPMQGPNRIERHRRACPAHGLIDRAYGIENMADLTQHRAWQQDDQQIPYSN